MKLRVYSVCMYVYCPLFTIRETLGVLCSTRKFLAAHEEQECYLRYSRQSALRMMLAGKFSRLLQNAFSFVRSFNMRSGKASPTETYNDVESSNYYLQSIEIPIISINK